MDRLRIGGVGLISGPPEKRGRRDESTQLGLVEGVLQQDPAVLVLHEGPDEPVWGQRGNSTIRSLVEPKNGLLVICGHSHWEHPLVTLPGGAQVLNVDARAVLLQRAR